MSLRKAIDRFCKSCLYSPTEPGHWRQQITACTAAHCPLYPVRPQSKAVRPGAVQKGGKL